MSKLGLRDRCTAAAVVGLAVLPWGVQAQSCEFSLGPDTTLCAGQYLLLHGPDGALAMQWQNGQQSQFINTEGTGTYWCTALFPITGDNVVQNGDFSLGDTLFSTDFVYGTGGSWGLLSAEGTYAITTDPSLVHNNFASCTDHSGTGQMLVVNGSGLANADIWCQTVVVAPNTDYAFSAWLMSTTSANPAIMDFQVNGQSLGTPLLASSTTCEWDQFYATWNSGAQTTATICIINQQLALDGNDFALDDIEFAPLCSWTDSVEVTVMPAQPVLELGEGGALCPGETAEVSSTLVPAWPNPAITYAWSTGETTPGITVPEPGTYGLAVSDGHCLNVADAVVFLPDTCGTDLSMPNVFTPNSDGVNDGFGPIFTNPPSWFSMEVRNRWGQVVFTSHSANNRWNGRAADGVLPDGTYFWVVRYGKLQDNGGTSEELTTGVVTLLGAP